MLVSDGLGRGGKSGVNGDSEFQIGPWQVKPLLGTLTGPGGTVHLEPKVMGVLVHLAERRGEVVTREQFIERVWHGRVVTDEVLSRCISLLRTQLGDNPREPQYIQTVPKIGYRLVMPVERAITPPSEPAAAPRVETPAPRVPGGEVPIRRRSLLWAIGAMLVLALGLGVWRWIDRSPAPGATDQAAIAVLPFVNVSGDRGNEYFSDGLTEELIDRLAHVPGLRVVARTSAFALKGSNEDVRAIAGRLGVHYVLEGSVRKEGDRVRITAQLIDAERGFYLWSERFDGELRQIFTLQDAIANAIVTQLTPRLADKRDRTEISTAPPTQVIPAYELLLRGRYNLKRRDEAPIRRSIELFQEALQLDPAFIDAYTELAGAYALLPYYSYEDQEEMFDLALATIERGAAVNPAVRDAAEGTRAFIHFGRWEWVEAEEAFRHALATHANDPNLEQWYSQLLAGVGNAPESLKHAELAKRLDVLSPVVNDRLAVAYLWVNEDERARVQFELADELGMGPTANPEAYLVLLLRQKQYPRAREILIGLQKLFARANEWIDPFLAALADPALRPAAVAAVAQATEQHSISLKYQYGVWLYLGEADRAIDAAMRLVDEPTDFDVEFLFARETAPLRRHPRFGELITRIGLDRYWDRYGWPDVCARKGHRIECH
ncbi:MAG TPA: winged helix-turn-helix domain-containing tetratricopeptide repeat protein [Steroidobacteraceae bacterium]|nr:winged helix-turn-helix domain-containing tetratricopeptide repeat protein [Steroidobacteraceae bacterium]